ncbi:hypothetical protein EYF80_005185 [Liparis tanakae]|uniref:Uncharacterized protein n=1 Tax=Liparis tanakae TaxID=230148 RepID=A0A4Z2J2A7_9TELE|nr:hypothetical protein EYF80_005185 [Liparis tanakae]
MALQISSGGLPTFLRVMARFLALLESSSVTLLGIFWVTLCLLLWASRSRAAAALREEAAGADVRLAREEEAEVEEVEGEAVEVEVALPLEGLVPLFQHLPQRVYLRAGVFVDLLCFSSSTILDMASFSVSCSFSVTYKNNSLLHALQGGVFGLRILQKGAHVKHVVQTNRRQELQDQSFGSERGNKGECKRKF